MSLTMITGADGHIGKALAHWLLVNSDDELLLLVRAGSREVRQEKRTALGTLAGNPRCRIEFVELTDPEPFARLGGQRIARIVHSAAVTSFAVDRETAFRANVEGTRKLVCFARECPDLQRFCLISSLYTAGLRNGEIDETCSPAEPVFANYYEWSKWQAELAVIEDDVLPWHICRVATVIGEDNSGTVVQQNAIHNTLRLLYYGLLSVVPGEPETRVYLTSTDFVVNAIGSLLRHHRVNGVFHLCEPGIDAIRLSEVIDIVYARFSEDVAFATRRILKPLFCDRTSFETLMAGIEKMPGPAFQSMHSVAPFAPQLYSDKSFQTLQLEKALPGWHRPCSRALLKSVTDYLVDTRWGLRQSEGALS